MGSQAGEGPSTIPASPNSIAIADFNAMATWTWPSPTAAPPASMLTGGLGGTFSAPADIPVTAGATAIAVGDFDFDADKDPDLAVVGSDAIVTTLLGSTGSLFETGQTLRWSTPR